MTTSDRATAIDWRTPPDGRLRIGFSLPSSGMTHMKVRMTPTGLVVVKPPFGRCGGKAKRRRWERRNGH
jgi:hypothetical protein